MFLRLRAPALRVAAAATAAAAIANSRRSSMEGADRGRFSELSDDTAPHFTPAVPYPGWDRDWDHLQLSTKDIARELRHEWPIADFAAAIRKLFKQHTNKAEPFVEALLRDHKEDLPKLYRESYVKYAYGGGPVRYLILVRHGQYEEHYKTAAYKAVQSEIGPQAAGLDELLQRGSYLDLDRRQGLTALGREQAAATGERLAALLHPALTTPGREADVRIHVSTLTRAKETADIIASKLPSHVGRLPPDRNLSEGSPPVPDLPDAIFYDPRSAYVEGARIEAAFRSLCYRGLPQREVGSAARHHHKESRTKVRCEYDIVVAHGNVIRYFLLRALQLPPEAWLRFGGMNGSVTILRIAPATGRVSCIGFGDFGHLSLEQATFSMSQGLEPPPR
jgi:serine/threonine-protein phosphatase PGAM5